VKLEQQQNRRKGFFLPKLHDEQCDCNILIDISSLTA